jgi:hypothetical protein
MPRFSIKIAPGVRVYGGGRRRSSRVWDDPFWGWFLGGLLVLALLIAGVNSLFGIGGAAEHKAATTSVPLHCPEGGTPERQNGYGAFTCPDREPGSGSYPEAECPDGSRAAQNEIQGVMTVECDGRVVGKF